MTRRLVLATHNADKVREMRRLFADLPLSDVVSAEEINAPDVVEDGDTLKANALKKAREIAAATGELSLADDTGLMVDALDGAPGVYSARYAGEDATYQDNCSKLVREMAGVADGKRTARFATVMALVDPHSKREWTVEGVLEGTILTEGRGDRGFGYDPVFFAPEAGQTLAEMSIAEKNQISHRARAATAMHAVLAELLGLNENRESSGS